MMEADKKYLLERVSREDRGHDTPCWIWQLGTNRQGYARMLPRSGHDRPYRLAYQVFVGPIPEGLTIDHLCRVPNCCNPQHLEVVTRRENILRAVPFRTPRVLRPICLRGHDTTVVGRKRNNGQCAECHREDLRRTSATRRRRALV